MKPTFKEVSALPVGCTGQEAVADSHLYCIAYVHVNRGKIYGKKITEVIA